LCDLLLPIGRVSKEYEAKDIVERIVMTFKNSMIISAGLRRKKKTAQTVECEWQRKMTSLNESLQRGIEAWEHRDD
jgi:hypothetical protein